MPQLVLGFPGSFRVCYSAFPCVFETTAAGVTALKRDGLNICFQCLTKCRPGSNCSGMVPIYSDPVEWSQYIKIQRNGPNIFRSSQTVISPSNHHHHYTPAGTLLCPKTRGLSNIKRWICTGPLTRICECLCKIKMNVRLKQTSVDYSISVTSCTSSFYCALLSYNVASLVSLTMI